MNTAAAMTKKIVAFRAWLSGCGAEVLDPTNEYELARFKANGQTGVIYRNRVGGVSYNSEYTQQVWQAFQAGAAWRATPATRRKGMGPHKQSLLNRDGSLCFFCQTVMGPDNMTVEHLVAITHGGPNHISNLFLAHKGCNIAAGHLSAPEKVAIHARAVVERRLAADRAAGRWPWPVDAELED